jgi:hypothetical protein
MTARKRNDSHRRRFWRSHPIPWSRLVRRVGYGGASERPPVRWYGAFVSRCKGRIWSPLGFNSSSGNASDFVRPGLWQLFRSCPVTVIPAVSVPMVPANGKKSSTASRPFVSVRAADFGSWSISGKQDKRRGRAWALQAACGSSHAGCTHDLASNVIGFSSPLLRGRQPESSHMAQIRILSTRLAYLN